NRLEREFYGFGKVIEEQRDAAHADALYRAALREFRTDSFYARGLQTRELTQDAAGHPFVEVVHGYKFRDVQLGAEPADQTALLQSTTATVFPELDQTD